MDDKKIKDLTFKISMVYDERRFSDALYDPIQDRSSKKGGGDLNDQGGIDFGSG
ncbi:MAG: hypothetical protein HXY44_18305 [Syntrophaceae bacterium]|nr:hypothetical protein [Syntrophaceae bacterium]